MVLEPMKDSCVRQIGALLKEMLANLIVGLVVQVFGSESSLIDGSISWIMLANQMLLDQFHRFPPSLFVLLLAPASYCGSVAQCGADIQTLHDWVVRMS